MVLSRLTKITSPGIKTDTNWVGNNANFTGVTTAGSSFNVGISTFHSTLAEVHNIKSTGIITATGGSFSGNVTAVDGTFTGNVSIAGTLTYEDVTNVDSVGIVTAAAVDVDDFLDVGSNIKLGNAGVITATSFVGSGAALTGIDATAIKDTSGNVKIQAQASGAIHTGVSTFQDLDIDGHTNLDNVSVAGITTYSKSGSALRLNDGSILRLGNADADFFLYHDGNNIDYISAGASKQLRLTTDDFVIKGANNTETLMTAAKDGAVTLYHNNISRLSTSSVGVSIPQDLDVDGHTNLDNVSVAGIITSAVNVHTPYVYISGTQPGVAFNETDSENDFTIGLQAGTWKLRDTDGGVDRYQVNSSGQHTVSGSVTIDAGNVTINRDLDVDGHTNLDNVSIAGVSTISNHLFLKNDGAYIDFKQTDGTQTGYIQSRTTDFRFNSYGARPVKFGTNDIERVRIDSDGKVGINTDDARFNNASNIASASFYHNDPKFGVHGSMVIGNLSGTATDERQLAFYRRGGPAPGTPMSTHKMGRIAWYGSSNDTSLPDLAGFIECVPNGGGWTAGSNRRGSITFNNHEKETVRINSAGYVGIGTDNPTTKLQITDTSATILRTEATANDGDALIQALGKDSSGNDRMIQMRTDAGADQYRIISSDTSYNLALCTGNAPRVLIAGNSAATSIGGSNVFNAMLTVQGDISGQLLNLKATENTTRLMVSGTDTTNCEVNIYDAGGTQRGIIVAENDGMSMKGGGTPSQLQFFTTVTGGSSTRRLLIDDYGATQVERGSNGWSTLFHKTNNGGTRFHYRQASAGSSGTTINLMRIRRHYWGSGHYKIKVRQTYYNGSAESHFWIHGHAANGNTTSFSINHNNVNVGNGSWIQKTSTSHSSPGNNYAGWIDVFISVGAYEYYDIIIEASGMAQYSQDINNLGNDAYALHAV